MPRANRYFVPGQVYHLTHRCHDRRFLLKFARDRTVYRTKLRKVVRRSEVSLLDFCVTSNHVHLLACSEDTAQISLLMQRVEGEFAQSYNRRKDRTGAYWGDRFHSTMIESGRHLMACMVYIALNMVRCGVVAHPRDWSWCGYHELVGVRQRYRILDVARVLALLGGVTVEDFRGHYEEMINERIAKDQMRRDPRWTEAVAVGSEGFVRGLATRIKGRQKLEIGPGAGDGEWVLREAVLPYTADGPTETGSKP